jgi:hypothetical protein
LESHIEQELSSLLYLLAIDGSRINVDNEISGLHGSENFYEDPVLACDTVYNGRNEFAFNCEISTKTAECRISECRNVLFSLHTS